MSVETKSNAPFHRAFSFVFPLTSILDVKKKIMSRVCLRSDGINLKRLSEMRAPYLAKKKEQNLKIEMLKND